MSDRLGSHLVLADPFELPEWLADGEVVWLAGATVSGSPHLTGTLTGPQEEQRIALDLVAVDSAVPAPICPEHHRTEAHRAWQRGESLLLDDDGRATLAVPGYVFDSDLVCEALRRFTRAVGAAASNYTAQIRL